MVELPILKPTSWGTKYKNALNTYATANGGALTSANLAAATQYARHQADASRVLPGTAAFDDLKNTIIKINNWDIKSSQFLMLLHRWGCIDTKKPFISYRSTMGFIKTSENF